MSSTTSTSSSQYGWENGPMKLIPTPISQTGATDQYTSTASEMALVHNCIIRAFNGIYVQAPLISPTDYKSFVSYSVSCFRGLEAHHTGEEEHFFPAIEAATGRKGIMETNVHQHEAFHEGLQTWGTWLEKLLEQNRTHEFSGTECVRLMDAFLGPLSQHLADEIPTLLSLAEFGDAINLAQMAQEEAEIVMKGMSKTKGLPVFLLNHDVTFEGGIHNFPPLPPPVKWVLMNCFARVKGDWWKFAACGFDGRPRGLYVDA